MISKSLARYMRGLCCILSSSISRFSCLSTLQLEDAYLFRTDIYFCVGMEKNRSNHTNQPLHFYPFIYFFGFNQKPWDFCINQNGIHKVVCSSVCRTRIRGRSVTLASILGLESLVFFLTCPYGVFLFFKYCDTDYDQYK